MRTVRYPDEYEISSLDKVGLCRDCGESTPECYLALFVATLEDGEARPDADELTSVVNGALVPIQTSP